MNKLSCIWRTLSYFDLCPQPAKFGFCGCANEIFAFWDVTRRRLVVSNRRFGTTYRSRLQGPGSPRLGPLFRTHITLSPDSPQSFVVSLISLERASSQKRWSLYKLRYRLIRRCRVPILAEVSKYPDRLFMGFPSSSCRYSTVKIGHDRFLLIF